MTRQIEDLKKFFQLEISRKYDNRSIVGGFQKLLPFWVSDESLQQMDALVYQSVIKFLNEYATASIPSRKAKIEEISRLLAKTHTLTESPQPAEKQQKKAAEPKSKDPSPLAKPQNSPAPPTNQSSKNHHVDLKIKSSLRSINSIGKSREKSLMDLGINTIEDLIYFFPRKYEDFRKISTIDKLQIGEQVTVAAVVKSIHKRKSKNRNMDISEVVIEDGTGSLRISFFNQPYLENQLKIGSLISVKGKVDTYLGRLVMNSPAWEKIDQESEEINGITPIYKVPEGFSQKAIQKIIKETLTIWGSQIEDYLPAAEIRSHDLMGLKEAIIESHIPKDFELLEKAKNRISFDQIFFLQMGVLGQKNEWNHKTAAVYRITKAFLASIFAGIPYELTNAQLACIHDIQMDFACGKPMNRLIQGDVGSGKTLVAFVAICMILSQPATQCAFMAPTSILADQHYKKSIEFFVSGGFLQADQICLLIGDTSAKDKEMIKDGLSSGKIRLVFGTHALIEEPVVFHNLQLAVIDEQHRFGVDQRKKLIEKSPSLHLLVMTATPIPRSLALTIYGDLDLSVMNEMPVGRLPIKTQIVNPNQRDRVYRFIRANITEGNQAFIVYPLVTGQDEETESSTKAAVYEYERLKQEVFSEFNVGLLHGKMKPADKEQIMADFYSGKYQILIATTVIEVGVDVPNATIMMIEGANRFGLSQLHQLRGRVGRGKKQSYCFLIPETQDSIENERLTALQRSVDGFELAEIDLAQRGPGDFLGERQSGFKDLTLMNIMNVKLIEKARTFAEKIFAEDPKLLKNENQEMKKFLNYYWNQSTGDLN
jgi:ATP-dependent DNA helicase RecG